jgi:uncharacterized membrane protein (UPF0127 family)
MNLWKRLVVLLRQLNPSRPEVQFQVVNLTRGTIVATRMAVADTAKTRNKGLLNRESLSAGEGLWIVPCQAIHMFFMRFPIDLVYIDGKRRVRKVRSRVAPWRISVCLSAHSVLELPAGVVRNTMTVRGDTLEISPVSVSQSRPLSQTENTLGDPAP